jgi:hypothetical protein
VAAARRADIVLHLLDAAPPRYNVALAHIEPLPIDRA